MALSISINRFFSPFYPQALIHQHPTHTVSLQQVLLGNENLFWQLDLESEIKVTSYNINICFTLQNQQSRIQQDTAS